MKVWDVLWIFGGIVLLSVAVLGDQGQYEIPYLDVKEACAPEGLKSNATVGYIGGAFFYRGDEKRCRWTLNALEDETTENKVVNIYNKGINFDVSCDKSRIVISTTDSDGHENVIGTYCGNKFPRKLIVSGRSVHFSLIYTEMTIFRGFLVYFEVSPPPANCTSMERQCRNGIKCYSFLNEYCNGVDDCGDGTDEEDCPGSDLDFPESLKCGLRVTDGARPMPRIMGGTDAPPNSWPWFATLRIVIDAPPARHMCGATLIHRRWLLTAAHCFVAMPEPSDWVAYLGRRTKEVDDPSGSQRLRYIEKIVLHPDYRGHIDPRLRHDDVALLQLNAPLDYSDAIRHICLANTEEDEATMAHIAGMGMSDHNALLLQEAKVPLVNRSLCQQWLPSQNITEGVICAGYEAGEIDSCVGDSGGPLIQRKGSAWHQIGVVSFGEGCAEEKKPGIYTKVAHYYDWIRKTIEAA